MLLLALLVHFSFPGLNPSTFHLVAPVHPVVSNVTVTSYSWAEPAHRRFGKSNCSGGDLTVPIEGCAQCAADTSYYPLGSKLELHIGKKTEIRIVTDCGSAVRGRYHLDLHYNTMQEMTSAGSSQATIIVLRRGWNG